MSIFSEQTLTALQAAGWFPGREIDISDELQGLEQRGYPVFPAVIDFLKEFGRLHITIAREVASPPSRVPIIYSTMYIDTEHSFADSRSMVEAFSEDLDVDLCPIGNDTNGITLVMGSDGKVYGIYNPILFLIGNSGEQAIENHVNWTPTNKFQTLRDYSKED